MTAAVPRRADAVVIGAGIVGAAAAFYLARAGVEAVLVERGSVAGGTSGSGEGNILLSDKMPGPELELAKYGVKLWHELAAGVSGDVEFEPKGGIVVAEDTEQLPRLTAQAETMRTNGVACELLDAGALQDAEPRIARDLPGGLYFPDDCQVQPMLACMALVDAAERSGAGVFVDTDVQDFKRDSFGKVAGVVTNRGTIATPVVMVACGPWSAPLCEKLGVRVPVEPRKGHIIVTEPTPPLVRHKVYEANYVDAVASGEAELQIASVVESTKSGTILIGSSRERVGFDATVNPEIVAQLARRAVRYFPPLARVQAIRAYVGFRPYLPDHLPAFGALPGVFGAYVNCGHEGAGIALGPASSQLLVEQICGRTPPLDIGPFDPARFATEPAYGV